MPTRAAPAIYVPAVGQYDNIGDVLLRRPLLRWLAECGPLRVYTGPAPHGYVSALALPPGATVYRGFAAWYRALLRDASRGRADYVFKPGEIQLTLTGMKEHVGMLPALALVRARRRRVVRAGVGARQSAAIPRLLLKPSVALSTASYWRDAGTRATAGAGHVLPDLAFAEPGTGAAAERDTLTISLRGDRPLPPRALLDGARAFAAGSGRRLLVVTQVARDDQRSRMLAQALDAELLPWDGHGHGAQERRLRDAYARSTAVVSDRLHVLIAAVTEGAAPLGLAADASTKVQRHFEAAGMDGVGHAIPSTASLVAELIAASEQRRTSYAEPLTAARGRLASLAAELPKLLGRAP